MFKRISIFLIVLLTVLCFVGGASAVGVFVEKDAANTYIKYVDSAGNVIMTIDDTEGVVITNMTTSNTYVSMTLTSTTDASDLSTASFVTPGGVAIVKQLYLGDDIDMTVSGNGVYDITLKDTVNDALSIVGGSTDMMVFDTDTDAILIVPPLTVTGSIISDSVTDTTGTTSGAIQTDGGIGIAKNLWVGVDTRLVGTLTCDDVVSLDDTTESTGSTDGSFHTDGGVGIAKKLYVVGAVDFSSTLQLDGALTVSVNGAGADVKFYANSTGHLVWLEQGGDTDGKWHFGADTHGIMVSMYGGASGSGVFWDPNTDTNGTLSVGASGGSAGVDLFLYGNTTGKYVKWDQGTDDLLLVGAGLVFSGTQANEVIAIAGTYATGISLSGTLSSATSRAIKSTTTINNANLTDGYGTNEFDLTITGTGAGHIATTSSWLNIGSGTHGAGGSWLTPMTVGVWEDVAATITGASITFGMHMQANLGDTDAARLTPFSINVSGDSIDAIWNAALPADYLGYAASTNDGESGIVPFLIDSNGRVWYIRLYDS